MLFKAIQVAKIEAIPVLLENEQYFCSRYADKRNYQIRTDKLIKTCTRWYAIMDFVVAFSFILVGAAIVFWITKPR